MAAVAATETALLDVRLEPGGRDASALHRFADRLVSAHAATPPGDGAAFLAHIEQLAAAEAQRREWSRQLQHLQRRSQRQRVRQLPDGGHQDVLFDLAAPLTT